MDRETETYIRDRIEELAKEIQDASVLKRVWKILERAQEKP